MEDTEIIDTIYGKFSRTSKRRLDISFDSEACEVSYFHKLAEALEAEVVLDVGANIGLYAIHSLSLPTVKDVVAIEASEATYRELKKNISVQKSNARISEFFLAASNRKEVLKFYEYGEMAGHNGLAETSFVGTRQDSKVVEVQAERIDDIVSFRNKVIAMKIDVEGHECEVIEGAEQLLSQASGLLQVEIVSDGSLEKVRAKLGRLGFRMLGFIKNDYYFVSEKAADRFDALRELMFAEIKTSLALLQEANRVRRQALRLCRQEGAEFGPVRKILAYGVDPLFRV